MMTRARTMVRSARSRATQVRAGEFSFVALVVIVVFGSLLGIVALQTLIVQNRLQYDDVTRQLDEAQEENRRLRLEVIELEAPDRILDTAVERLGMTRPDQRRYLRGIDPELVAVRLPPSANPFAPGPLPAWFAERPTETLQTQEGSAEGSDPSDGTTDDVADDAT